MNNKIIQLEIKTLGDLSQRADQHNTPLPNEWIDWLCRNIPETQAVEYRLLPPPGALGILLPHTKVVLKVPLFFWGALQALLSAAGVYHLQGDALSQALLGLGIGNALRDLNNAFVKLKEHEGHYCGYSALTMANYTGHSGFAALPCSAEEAWKKHHKLQKNCPVTGCRFHKNGCCLTEHEFAGILRELLSLGVAKEDDGTWQIIF
ncbi:hypothetical protein [Endothiovibrio diazotrophicus]